MRGLSNAVELPPGLVKRPRVKSELGPRAHAQMVRAMEAARERLREAGSTGCAACPAASVLGAGVDGLAVRCGVERSVITEREDPSTLAHLCTVSGQDGYQRCPSWRAEKDRIRSGRTAPLVPATEGV